MFDPDEYVYKALRAGASGFVLKDIPPVAVVVLIVVLVNLSGDDSPTSDTEVPAPAPVTTVAP